MSTERARELRRNATKAERLLRHHLCGKREDSLRFRFQHPVGPYIVDFYCSAAKLVIEIDDWSHDDTYRYDIDRKRWLGTEGYDIVRFTNAEVLADPRLVAEAITRLASELIAKRFLRMRSVADSAVSLES
ncbi:MAG: endonuclease domain-containing protein [Fimbriimonadales bacterium]